MSRSIRGAHHFLDSIFQVYVAHNLQTVGYVLKVWYHVGSGWNTHQYRPCYDALCQHSSEITKIRESRKDSTNTQQDLHIHLADFLLPLHFLPSFARLAHYGGLFPSQQHFLTLFCYLWRLALFTVRRGVSSDGDSVGQILSLVFCRIVYVLYLSLSNYLHLNWPKVQ